MTDTRGKYVPPSIKATAFSCPHCGTLTSQRWYDVHAAALHDRAPMIFDADWLATHQRVDEGDLPSAIMELLNGRPVLWEGIDLVRVYPAGNLFLSHCSECKQLSIWLFSKLLWPVQTTTPKPSSDMPDNIRVDYDEASEILDRSPRGSAALLRLCVQKLCKYLGEKGENLNDDIAALVKRGLDVHIQQALDILRVTGNNAVHPGQMDIQDDRATASNLFSLLNLIVDELISKPARIQAIYSGLPEKDIKAIERRNAKALENTLAANPEVKR